MTFRSPTSAGSIGMPCPACGYVGSEVLDTRPRKADGACRRRRACLSCKARWTTIEAIVPRDAHAAVEEDAHRQAMHDAVDKLADAIVEMTKPKQVPA